MSHYESALITDRMSDLSELVRHQRDLAEVRRGKLAARAEAPNRPTPPSGARRSLPGLRTVTGLRAAARRGLKGRRSLI
jgi:hypothetical protein